MEGGGVAHECFLARTVRQLLPAWIGTRFIPANMHFDPELV